MSYNYPHTDQFKTFDDGFSNTFINVYNDMKSSVSTSSYSTEHKINKKYDPKSHTINFKIIDGDKNEIKPNVASPPTLSEKIIAKPYEQTENTKNVKKIGFRELLNKSKIIYPFESTIGVKTADEIKNLNNICQTITEDVSVETSTAESVHGMEPKVSLKNIVESVISTKTIATEIVVPIRTNEASNVLSLDLPTKPEPSKYNNKPFNFIIENPPVQLEKIDNINDNKNHHTYIYNMKSNNIINPEVIKMNTDNVSAKIVVKTDSTTDKITSTQVSDKEISLQIPEDDKADKINVLENASVLLEPTTTPFSIFNQEHSDMSNIPTEEQYKWPTLTIDDINTSFKVVADLQAGSKLKIINKKHLATDDSYALALTRYNTGQGREIIISFLEHMFKQTEQNVYDILTNIRLGVNIDNNVSILSNLIYKMATFLHRFDVMRSVYVKDSSTHARLGNIRDNFFTFHLNLFREMTVSKS